MADLQTKRLRMVSWNKRLVQVALEDKFELGRILNVEVPNGFPNDPVREIVLPMKLKELEQDPNVGKWSGMIVHVSHAILIGSMGFKSPPDLLGNVEIGYDIIAEYQGHGYATEMAQALIKWAFHQPNVNRVRAECLVTNVPSVRVLEKVGMKRLSQSEDMIYWEMNKR